MKTIVSRIVSLDTINICLMIVSACIAFVFPFELFLVAYAVLGPLHYLTELSWLKKRDFFLKQKSHAFLLTVLAIVFCFSSFLSNSNGLLIAASVMAILFIWSAIFILPIRTRVQGWLCAASALLILLLQYKNLGPTFEKGFFVFFAIFLPTIIHVFLFTGCFILYGALKRGGVMGYVSLFVFTACSAALLFAQIDITEYTVSSYIREAYANFTHLNIGLFDFAHIFDDQKKIFTNTDVYSTAGLSIMRFIAFAYTYHYLNWFSKTNIIKWHKVSQRTLVYTFLIWIGCIALYAYNYQAGILVLYVLSLLHVVLEFPLNHTTSIGIFQEVLNRIRKIK
jgi:hypothetical protein